MKIEMDFEVWLKFQDKREDEVGKFARKYLIYLRGQHRDGVLYERIAIEMAKEDFREGFRLAMTEYENGR